MDVGNWVNVIDEGGNICATGQYLGLGVPSKDVQARYPHLKHYAIQVEGQVRYYPAGFHTLVLKS